MPDLIRSDARNMLRNYLNGKVAGPNSGAEVLCVHSNSCTNFRPRCVAPGPFEGMQSGAWFGVTLSQPLDRAHPCPTSQCNMIHPRFLRWSSSASSILFFSILIDGYVLCKIRYTSGTLCIDYNFNTRLIPLLLFPKHKSQASCGVFVGSCPTRMICRWVFVPQLMNWTITLGVCREARCISTP